MRLTTKIVFGIIGAIFLASITCIIVLSIGYERKESTRVEELDKQIKESNEKKVAISVPSYKNMILDLNISENESEELLDRVRTFIGGCVYFTSAPIDSFNVSLPEDLTQDKKIVLIPETLEAYVKWTIDADGTLRLLLKPSEDLLYPYKERDYFIYRPKIEIIVLSESIERFCSEVNNINADFKGINANLMEIGTNDGDISISDCNIGTLIPKTGREKKVKITNSKIKDLNVDFSSGLQLNTFQCEIETGHFRGNTDTWNVNGKSDFRKINWVQNDKDKPLNFKLKTDSVTLVFP